MAEIEDLSFHPRHHGPNVKISWNCRTASSSPHHLTTLNQSNFALITKSLQYDHSISLKFKQIPNNKFVFGLTTLNPNSIRNNDVLIYYKEQLWSQTIDLMNNNDKCFHFTLCAAGILATLNNNWQFFKLDKVKGEKLYVFIYLSPGSIVKLKSDERNCSGDLNFINYQPDGTWCCPLSAYCTKASFVFYQTAPAVRFIFRNLTDDVTLGLTSFDPAVNSNLELPQNVEELTDLEDYWIVLPAIWTKLKASDVINVDCFASGRINYTLNDAKRIHTIYVDKTVKLFFFVKSGGKVEVFWGKVPENKLIIRNAPLLPASVGKLSEPDEDSCKICLDRRIDSVLYNCGHMSMCFECANEQWRRTGGGLCPLCRAVIKDVIRVFKS